MNTSNGPIMNRHAVLAMFTKKVPVEDSVRIFCASFTGRNNSFADNVDLIGYRFLTGLV